MMEFPILPMVSMIGLFALPHESPAHQRQELQADADSALGEAFFVLGLGQLDLWMFVLLTFDHLILPGKL